MLKAANRFKLQKMTFFLQSGACIGVVIRDQIAPMLSTLGVAPTLRTFPPAIIGETLLIT